MANDVRTELPLCWEDDARMNCLFAPFRSKNVNPVDWDSKMSFWCNLISDRCDVRFEPFFTLEDLKSAFQRKNKHPACLETVINYSLDENLIQSKEIFMKEDTSGWIQWGVKQIFRPATWATSAVINSILPSSNSKTLSSVIFVHNNSLKNIALSFLKSISDENKIGTMTELQASSNIGNKLSNDTLMLIMKWLISHNFAVYSKNERIYKLSSDNKIKISLTDNEIILYRLSKTRHNLSCLLGNWEKNIVEFRESARSSISKGNKTMALNYLRQKKNCEKRMDKTFNSIESITQLIDTLKQTHLDAQILNIYKDGLKAIKSVMKEKDLKEDKVLDTMDDLKQVMEEYRDIENIISQPVDETYEIDDLEIELADLINKHNNDGNSGKTEDLNDSILSDLSGLNINSEDPSFKKGENIKKKASLESY